MQNPFESGQIKNYILFYIGVVTIMVLFFMAATLFNKPQKIQKKKFSIQQSTKQEIKNTQDNHTTIKNKKYKLLKKGY